MAGLVEGVTVVTDVTGPVDHPGTRDTVHSEIRGVWSLTWTPAGVLRLIACQLAGAVERVGALNTAFSSTRSGPACVPCDTRLAKAGVGGSRHMHARVSRFQGSGEDAASRPKVEDVLPTLREMDGFRGLISLVHGEGGDALAITLWETEEAMRASDARADEIRREMANAAGDEIRSVERYEVEALQLDS